MKNQNKLLLSAVAICVANSVAAQEQGRIEAGQFDIIPSFNTSMSYIDNVARARDGQAKIYSWRSILSPELIAATEVDGNPVQFGYRLERGTYFSSGADDYTDHFVEWVVEKNHIRQQSSQQSVEKTEASTKTTATEKPKSIEKYGIDCTEHGQDRPRP